jgi:integrase
VGTENGGRNRRLAKSNLLTAVKVARMREPGRYSDGGGLYLQVSKWRTKAWLFRFERDGRERLMGLGPVDIVSLADARERAKEARRLLLDGEDPIEHRKATRVARRIESAKDMTFEHCADAYIKAHAAGWRNEKHGDQWRATLATYAFPVIGKLPVAAVDTPLVLKVLRPIWDSKTETANRLRGRIEKVLDYARVSGYRAGENPARWKGHLDHMLARKSKVAPVRHRAALPYADIGSFMGELHKRDSVSARALEFLILCAARTGEVIGARRREFDMPGKLWTVPSSRTKSGREHRVPLCERAIEIVEKIGLPDGDDEFLFRGGNGKPLSNMAMLELLRGMRPGLTVHGFRSTFKDWAAETTAHENIVTEMALAHAVGDEVEAAYRRGDLFQKRRALIDDWAAYCGGERGGGKVVKLRRGRVS